MIVAIDGPAGSGKGSVAKALSEQLLGEAINYDKKSRSLVLEFKTMEDAIRAINILPFGVNYKIFLLDIDS